MVDIIIRELTAEDLGHVNDLLSSGNLRPEGILAPGTRCWGAFGDDGLAGMIGCEYENGCGLLRSALVRPGHRGRGIGRRLIECLLEDSRSRGLRAIYLFSTDAGPYWVRLGFRRVPVRDVMDAMPGAPQVRLFQELGWIPTEVAYALYL
jgi:N-acetylglutamate synthase-like GNAT family acetyltransferase